MENKTEIPKLLLLDDKSKSAVLSVAEVVQLEKRIEAEGTGLFELMQRAGASVSGYILHNLEAAHKTVIFSGSGNNGGDGWVIAGDLARRGYHVVLVTARSAAELSVEPARSAALETTAQGYATLTIAVDPTEEELAAFLDEATIAVDALLGIGFGGESVREPYRHWIDAINREREQRPALHVVSVDIPSGLLADTGKAARPCVAADTTITMLAPKPALVLPSSKQYCGTVFVARLI